MDETTDRAALYAAARARLLAERDRLRRRITALRAGGLREAETESTSELSGYDQHPADQGTETFEREKDLGLALDGEVLIDRVEAALARLDGGTYGTCRRCGRPIDAARLQALPWAELCGDCQREVEAAPRAGRGRPVEEDVLYPPFGRGGEDVWEDVERFGSSNTPQDAPPARDFADLAGNGRNDGVVQAVERAAGEDGVTGAR